ncbi:MAG: DUF3781 domain-containing protein [bacterium]|nr:DUF3781 domain-containing protein [bacterium]
MNNLINNIDKVHTTTLGIERIKKNINISNDVVEYIKNKILNKKSNIYIKGKNYYVEIDNIIITINSYNYCIITAHTIKH